MNDRGNFCEKTKTMLADSVSRTSTDEEWYAKRLKNVAKF
jgi:hypothetical protein